jgi:hypothetical protein
VKKPRSEHDTCKRIKCVVKWLNGIIDRKEAIPDDKNEKINLQDCDALLLNYFLDFSNNFNLF